MAGGFVSHGPGTAAPAGMKWDATVGGFVPLTKPSAVAAPSRLSATPQAAGVNTGAVRDTTPTAAPAAGGAMSNGGFQPAVAAAPVATTNNNDPRIKALMDALMTSATSTPTPDPGIADTIRQIQQSIPAPSHAPDYSGLDAKAEQIRGLLTALSKGEGLDVGNIALDPAAAAYRSARMRTAEQSRASEADRLAASGVTGSGEFDSRVAGINEGAGADIAGFEGNLADSRRTQKLNTGLTSAQLQLGDLTRQQDAVTTRSTAETQAESKKLSDLNNLLAVLMGQDATKRTNTASQQQLLETLLMKAS